MEVLKELKHHQLLTRKEGNIKAAATSHHPTDLHKMIARMEQELKKPQQPSNYLAVQPGYRTTNGTVICLKFNFFKSRTLATQFSFK